ncbi:hypothetical protein QTP88_013262 [Uroleucon formosanum]
MSDGRSRKSGSKYKRLREEREEKEKEVIKKTAKLETFFTSAKLKTELDITPIPTILTMTSPLSPNSIPTSSIPSVIQSDIDISTSSKSPEIIDDLTISKDPSKWVLNDTTLDYLLSKDIDQNIPKDFSVTRTYYSSINGYRSLTKLAFERQLKNGQRVFRKYLCYSSSKIALFCIPCRLFGVGNSKFGSDGYVDWNNVHSGLTSHEDSPEHIQSSTIFINRSKLKNRIDLGLQLQIQNEMDYWRNVLQRVVANGNFMTCLELISEFNPFLSNHIATYGNPGQGKTSYLSSTICEEFISLIAKKVFNVIIDEINHSKYFSIVVDSTPDISHIDELSFVVRCVKREIQENTPAEVERFLKFIPNVGHKAKDMLDVVISTLEEFGLNLQDCRGQSYDTAANMAGCYSGLKTRIQNLNPLAIYVPCAGHSLNLVGTSAVESINEAAFFFYYLEDMYVFFVKSTYRWELMKDKLKPDIVEALLMINIERDYVVDKEIVVNTIAKSSSELSSPTLKRASGTRWSCRHNACSAFINSWKEFMETLKDIENNTSEKPTNRRKAAGLKNKLSKFESVFMAVFWTSLLERFDKTSKMLQSASANLEDVVDLYKSLIGYVCEIRTDEMFQQFIEEAKKTKQEEYEWDQKRHRVRPLVCDELEQDKSRENEIVLGGKIKLQVIYFAVLDKIRQQLEMKHSGYASIYEKLNFLINIDNESISTDDIVRGAERLQQFYEIDIDENTFTQECIHFKMHIHNTIEKKPPGQSLFTFIRNQELEEIFPNVSIALRIFSCMAVTNCSAERSFSCLKRIKTFLRSSIGENRLNSLALLCIEAELVSKIHFNDIIEEFASIKSRRKIF